MPEIRIRLDKELNKKIEIYKAENELNSKEEAIVQMLKKEVKK